METNILLLDAAREALGRVQQTMRLSRDATVRALLAEHVAEQERRARLDPRRRLTHISTVLRYPLRPWNPKDPFPASPLRVRIDEDLGRRARAVGLRLPGQTRRRGGRDYQPRPLADAIVTAIARREPIQDPRLVGLMPVIRHGAADGLWRLTVAATATRTERALYERTADPLATQDRVTQELLFNEVAWHSEWRRDVLWLIALERLTGTEATVEEQEQMLFEQGREFEFAWAEELNRSGAEDDSIGELPPARISSHEGRAGAAIWRATRSAQRPDIVEWLAERSADQATYRMTPPGWLLTRPKEWVGVAARALPREMQDWVGEGKVLQLPQGSRSLIWPLLEEPGGSRLVPVPGLDNILPVLAKATDLEKVEILLRYQLEQDSGDDASDECEDRSTDAESGQLEDGIVRGALQVPAYVARTIGVIDEKTCAALVANAEAQTRASMIAILAELPPEVASDPELTAAMSCPAEFNDLLYERSPDAVLQEVQPRWEWPVTSLADEVNANRWPPQVSVSEVVCTADLRFQEIVHATPGRSLA